MGGPVIGSPDTTEVKKTKRRKNGNMPIMNTGKSFLYITIILINSNG
jgi:hypothetical protein